MVGLVEDCVDICHRSNYQPNLSWPAGSYEEEYGLFPFGWTNILGINNAGRTAYNAKLHWKGRYLDESNDFYIFDLMAFGVRKGLPSEFFSQWNGNLQEANSAGDICPVWNTEGPCAVRLCHMGRTPFVLHIREIIEGTSSRLFCTVVIVRKQTRPPSSYSSKKTLQECYSLKNYYIINISVR